MTLKEAKLINDRIYKIEEVHISKIKPYDTIINKKNQLQTISKTNLSYDSFMGYSINGDNYNGGRVKVIRVIFKQWKDRKVVN